MQVQVTLVSTMGYRAATTVIDVNEEFYKNNRRAVYDKAVLRICALRRWTGADLKKYGYTQIKSRVYDKEKIEKEKKERYEQIKKERGWK